MPSAEQYLKYEQCHLPSSVQAAVASRTDSTRVGYFEVAFKSRSINHKITPRSLRVSIDYGVNLSSVATKLGAASK